MEMIPVRKDTLMLWRNTMIDIWDSLNGSATVDNQHRMSKEILVEDYNRIIRQLKLVTLSIHEEIG